MLNRKFADIVWPIKYDGPLGLKIGSQKKFFISRPFQDLHRRGVVLRKNSIKIFKKR